MALIYVCPTDKSVPCSWEGYASEIKDHFEKNHNHLLSTTNSIELDTANLSNIKNAENRVLLYLHKEIYLVRNSFIEPGIVSIKLHYLGSQLLAAKKQYNISIAPQKKSFNQDSPGENIDNNNNYGDGDCYHQDNVNPMRYVTRTNEGWQINVEQLELEYGKVSKIFCTILIEECKKGINIIRHNSSIRQKKLSFDHNLRMLDDFERDIIKDLDYIDRKVQMLENKKRSESDLMDNVSTLNLQILEKPFREAHKSGEIERQDGLGGGEGLLEIPDETDLGCKSCSAVMIPPIYICNNGHNICGQCRKFNCGLCKGFITNYRNEELENVSRIYKHSCRYAIEGCMEKLLYSNVLSHEAECSYRTYKCQMFQCGFVGTFEKFKSHIRSLHFSCKVSEVATNMFPKNCEFYITNKRLGIFYCKSELVNDTITWEVVFCGPKEKSFFCEIMFKGSRMKHPNFLSKQENVYTFKRTLEQLKKEKAKEKYAFLTITS